MANKKRLIDVNAVIEKLTNLTPNGWGKDVPYIRSQWAMAVKIKDNFLQAITDAPTVDAVEVVHGYWEKEHDDLDIDRGWKCSHCKGSVYEMTYEPYQYCPHCGAKMDGGNEDG